jgi:hypothetical protein
MTSDNVKSHLRWLGLTVALKAVALLLYWSLLPEHMGIAPVHHHYLRDWWGYPWGDTPGYLVSMENLLQHGTYSPDYRMPGYGAFYFLFRLFLSVDMTMRALIVFQLVMSVIANYALARAAFLLTGRRVVFIIVLVLFCFSLKNIKWEFVFLTESLTTSFLANSLYFFIAHVVETHHKTRSSLLSGLFLGWAIFMRPVYFPLIILFAIALIIVEPAKVRWRYAFFFMVPFLLADLLWVGRNFGVHHRFIPLIKQVYLDDINKDYTGALLDFMGASGSAMTLHNPSGELAWYMPPEKSLGPRPMSMFDPKPPPEWLHTSRFNRDTLENLRAMIYHIEDTTLARTTRDSLNNEVVARLVSYTESIRTELPFVYYVKARLIQLRRHLVTTSTDFLPPVAFRDMSLQLRAAKIVYTILYVVTLGFSFCSLVAFLVYKRKLLAVPFGMAYAVLISPVVGLSDVRYLAPAYPLMIICAVCFGWWLANYISSKIDEKSLRRSSGVQ